MARRLSRSGGFTLIEMMVVVAIIGIIAAIAYPSYTQHVRKGQRASAKERMYDLQQREAAHFSEKGTFTLTLTDLGFPSETLTSQTQGHTITVEAAAAGIASGYRIIATPAKADPGCSPLTLDSLGAYGPPNC